MGFLFGGGASIGDIVSALMPLIILYMVGKALFPHGFGFLGPATSMFLNQRNRLRNEVKNDGTDRDYASLVRSCRAYQGYARTLMSDTQGDRDIRSTRWGRIIGISPRLTFTAILLRPRWFHRSIMLLIPNEMLSTLDRPVIRIRARAPVNLAEYFWFPEPLRCADINLNVYWQNCYRYIDEISKKRISIDCQGDMDFQLKCSQRNKPEEAKDEIINELRKRNIATDTEGIEDATHM